MIISTLHCSTAALEITHRLVVHKFAVILPPVESQIFYGEKAWSSIFYGISHWCATLPKSEELNELELLLCPMHRCVSLRLRPSTNLFSLQWFILLSFADSVCSDASSIFFLAQTIVHFLISIQHFFIFNFQRSSTDVFCLFQLLLIFLLFIFILQLARRQDFSYAERKTLLSNTYSPVECS